MLKEFKIDIIKKGSRDFPVQLYDLKACPKQLYVIGNKELLSEFSIAIVGARNCIEESKELASEISYKLSQNGIRIISGLAKGIDKIAHEACLKAHGKTIAVLGGGFNNLYPKENKKLFYNILENDGIIITEYSEDVPCLKPHFVERNRIIAALSYGIIVVEAKEKSGSLTTANYGFKLRRNVFSFPGSMKDSNHDGSNKLLVSGAKCILNYEDVLNEYPEIYKIYQKEMTNDVSGLNIPDEYMKIYLYLKEGEKNIDDLRRNLNIPINELNSKLSLMEIDGYIKQLPGKIFKLI